MNNVEKHGVKWDVNGRPACSCGFKFVAVSDRAGVTEQFHKHLSARHIYIPKYQQSAPVDRDSIVQKMRAHSHNRGFHAPLHAPTHID